MSYVESAQEKRLRLIDFYLYFFGKVNRSDLMKHGDIAIATASRAFSLYKEIYPKNTFFDESNRAYMKAECFMPAFEHDPEAALRLIAWGEEVVKIPVKTYGINSFSSIIGLVSADIVSQVTRAILNRKCLKIW